MINTTNNSLGAVPRLVRITSDTQTQSLLDTFCVTPQNITMRAHGTLVGFFRVYDTSTDIDTAYVCNFLTSVAKKEYYATTRRSPEESLEAALTKVNHALAELCANGNTDWLVGLDGAIVVFTDNAVHFSVCGQGRISLWRGSRITHISDGFVESTINPLVVFSDIASGNILDGDKFFIATRELSGIVTDTQLQSACIRYQDDDLEQFFHTALVNHSNLSALHIIAISPTKSGIVKRTAAIDVGTQKVKIPQNVFSASAYQGSSPAKNPTETPLEKINPADSGATQSKGQIYIAGDDTDTQKTPITEILAEYTHDLRKKLVTFSTTAVKFTSATAKKTISITNNAWRTNSPIIVNKLRKSKEILKSSAITSAQKVAQISKSSATTIAINSTTALNASHRQIKKLSASAKLAKENIQAKKAKKLELKLQEKTTKNARLTNIEPTTEQTLQNNRSTHTTKTKQSFAKNIFKSNTNTNTIDSGKLSASRFMQKLQQVATSNLHKTPTTCAQAVQATPKPSKLPTTNQQKSKFPASKNDQIEAFFARPQTPTQTTTQTQQLTTSKLTNNPIKKNIKPISAIDTPIKSNSQKIITQIKSICGHFLAQISKLSTTIKRLLPSPARLTSAATHLNTRGRLIATAILIIIIIVPLAISRFTQISDNSDKSTPNQITDTAPLETTPDTNNEQPELAQIDTSSVKVSRTGTIYTDTKLIALLFMHGELFGITPTTVTHISNGAKKQTYTIPTKYGKITKATTMDDLNMVLLVTDNNDVISFSLRARDKFIKNKIAFPAGIAIDKVDTYLTYLYIFDNSANAIYRYPRATGGFGTARSWLKDKFNLTATATTIDGNVYIAQTNGEIKALFRNKQINWNQPTLTPELKADALFTTDEKSPLYAADRDHARIVAIDKNSGKTTLNITNEDFRKIKTFTTDPRTRTITTILDNGAISTYRY